MRKSQKRFQLLARAANDIVWEWDLHSNRVWWDKDIASALGYLSNEVGSDPSWWFDRIHENDRSRIIAGIHAAVHSGQEFWSDEYRFRRADGSYGYFLDRALVVHNRTGRPVRMVGSMMDITQRKQVDNALRESEARLRLLVTQIPAVVWTTDSHLRFTSSQGAGLAALNLQAEDIVGKDLFEYFQTTDSAFEPVAAHRRALQGESVAYELEWNGRVFESHVHPLRDMEGRITGSVGIALDITDQKQAEQALRDSEERFRQMAENLDEAIVLLEDQGKRVLHVSSVYEKITGRPCDQLYRDAQSWHDFVYPDDRTRATRFHSEVAQGKISKSTEFRIIRSDGSLRWIWARSFPVYDHHGRTRRILTTWLDVTEQKGLEDQLRQGQKMEAVGRLAGGLAHDFNNLLTVINGYSQLLLDQIFPSNPLRTKIEEIRKAGERAVALTRRLLTFSRRQELKPQVLDLNAIFDGMADMLRPLLGEQIELAMIGGTDLGHVNADPGQMEQVIMNLAINARDAMPEGGKLTFETANVTLDENDSSKPAGLAPGHYVMLAVNDTGSGMDATTQALIFEPFFTTKEKGKGTGLGLATVYGIVKQSGGHISVQSELGYGTTFRIYLPLIAYEFESIKANNQPQPKMQEGLETVLIVEDEDQVRSYAREVLESKGYKVLEASDSYEAETICNHYEGSIDLLLTDFCLPQMSGPALVQYLWSLHSAMKVLFMSGYTNDATTQGDVPRIDAAFLEKPFTPESLACKVRQTLDA